MKIKIKRQVQNIIMIKNLMIKINMAENMDFPAVKKLKKMIGKMTL